MKSIDYNSIEIAKNEERNFIVSVAIVSLIVLYLYYNSLFVLILVVPVSCFSLSIYRQYRIRKRREYLVNQFRDILYSFSASVGAGRHMSDAFREGRENLLMIYPEDSPMIIELDNFLARISASNETEEEVLYDLADRSGIEDIKTFAEVYSIARSTGADILKVIGLTSQILLDKMTIVREIRSYTAQKKFEGRVISVMPPAIIFFLNVIAPEYLVPLYTTFCGRIIMTMCLAMTMLGLMIAEKITDINIWDDKEDKIVFKLKEIIKNRKGKSRKRYKGTT